MSSSLERLYKLLPYVYQQQDALQQYPLKALLQVIAEQVDVVEEDITQLYENWFIETAEDWVVPYIGDLVGYKPITEISEAEPDLARQNVLIPRREVAKTLYYRRRKGTLALLEELAYDITGWPARVVEFYKLLGQTQALNHLHLERGRTVDVRDGQDLLHLNTPFDPLAHTIDLRRINSQQERSRGFYHIPNIGLFVWRTKTQALVQTPAHCSEEVENECFTFSILGNNAPLYRRIEREESPTDTATEQNVPGPITRLAFEQNKEQFYGVNRSLRLFIPGTPPTPIPASAIIPADLSVWDRYRPQPGTVAVDPELGRILFSKDDTPKEGVLVSYYTGFGAELGGGSYQRPLQQPEAAVVYEVNKEGSREGPLFNTIQDAIDAWVASSEDNKSKPTIIEITDSQEYEDFDVKLETHHSLQIRAAQGQRPVIRVEDRLSLPDAINITLAEGSHLLLDGLLVVGRPMRLCSPESLVPASQWGQPKSEQTIRDWVQPAEITIRHCTLVPGWSLDEECHPKKGVEESLIFDNTPSTRLTVEWSILGSILVEQNEVSTEPSTITISDSILDATESELEALSAGECNLAHAVLTIKRSTVFGEIHTHAIDLGENSIFRDLVMVGRRQRGCLRFCSVDPDSRTPRRYNCQPDLVKQAVSDQASKDQEAERVRPQFDSVRYGTPTYAQLADHCAEEIKRGGEYEAEMGVYYHLFNPQREANLRARLAEFVPLDMEVGLIVMT